MPVTARRSERRVSSSSTTWSISSPYGNRTHPSSVRGWRPLADRRTGQQCVGQELNLHSLIAGGLQPLRLANAQPTPSQLARVGIEPTLIHQGLSLAALPFACQQACSMGIEPMTSTVTGWRALQTAQRGLSVVLSD
jgi:hypothetical protein